MRARLHASSTSGKSNETTNEIMIIEIIMSKDIMCMTLA